MRAWGMLLLFLPLTANVITLVCAKETPGWMKEITPAGYPCVEIDLAGSDRSEPFGKVILTHRLRFDGMRYVSCLSVAGLNSHLVPKGEHEYEWLTPAGLVIIINTKILEKNRTSNWRLVRDAVSGETAVVGGDQQVYIYRKSKLVEYEKKGRSYRINSENGICEVIDPKGNVLIRQIDGVNRSLTIAAFGSKAVLGYNKNRELISCAGDACGALEFGYRNGLLEALRGVGVGKQYGWGEITYLAYERSIKCIPPVVVKYNEYRFEYTAGRQVMFGTVFLKEKKLGMWNYSFKNGQYKYTDGEKPEF
jgi:hypothetical protein